MVSTKPPPPAPPTPRTQQQVKSPARTIVPAVDLGIEYGVSQTPDRVLLYGAGGVGKSTAARYLPQPLFLDTEGSSRKFEDIARSRVKNWVDLRGKLAGIVKSPPANVRWIVVDTLTVAEEFAKEYVIATRPTDKGRMVDSVEGYGWGKGWQFVFDEFNGLLADLDRLNELGYGICTIAHVVTSTVPNPASADWIRWEPSLYDGDKKGRGSIRRRVFNWAEHVVFIGYDVFVEDGRGQGSGTRSIYTTETPTHMAKSRTSPGVIQYTLDDPGAIWRALGIV